MTTKGEIKRLILRGEGQDLEFKERVTDELGKTICAFANTNDGIILVGVTDRGKILGASKKVEDRVANIAHSCKPAIYPKIRSIVIESKTILAIEVKRSKDSIHSYRNIAYKRVGTHNMPLSPEDVVKLAKETGWIRFDEEICEEATLKEVDLQKVEWWLERREQIRGIKKPKRMDLSQLLLSIEAAKEVEGKLYLTNAGVLFFGKEPQMFIPNAITRSARFRDKLMRHFIDQATHKGTIPEMIDQAVSFVERNVRLGGTRDLGIKRIDRLEYPLIVIREAITNAEAHRDYFSPADIRIAIFEDAIKIFNPGGFPEGFDLKNPTHIPRNRIICNMLFDIGYIEKWGSGIIMMREEMIKWGLSKPIFEDKGLELTAILYGAGDEIIETIAISEKYGDLLLELNDRQRKVLKFLEKERVMTKSEYTKVFKTSERTAERDLSKMVKLGILAKVGQGPATKYTMAR